MESRNRAQALVRASVRALVRAMDPVWAREPALAPDRALDNGREKV